jgi:dephospho-CoA kinase
MPYILGLTGNIACGKTTVGLLLLELGAHVYVDADTVVHELYGPGQPLVPRLAAAFGQQIVAPDGSVDRKTLGNLVFGKPAMLRQLEQIVHPAVLAALSSRLYDIPEHGVGVLDAVKLVESGYAPLCHAVWLVTCDEATQLSRLMGSRGLTEADARARLASQPSSEAKRGVVTEVIENDGSLDDVRQRVSAAWQRFVATLPGGEVSR